MTENGGRSPREHKWQSPESRERQLANLRPPWKPGESGNLEGRPPNTPLVSPAMYRFAQMPIEQLRDVLAAVILGEVPPGFTVAEAIALTVLADALKTGSFTTGAKSRDLVIERIDGAAPKLEVDVNVGVLVRYIETRE